MVYTSPYSLTRLKSYNVSLLPSLLTQVQDTILIQIIFGWCSLYLIKKPRALSPQTEHCFFSDGPDKAGSNFFCYGAMRFPQLGMFSSLHKEYIKLQKRLYKIKCIKLHFERAFPYV